MDELGEQKFSTHTTSLSLLFNAIPAETRPAVLLIGVQPGSMELLKGLSDPVIRSLDALEEVLIYLFPPGTTPK